MKIIIIYGNIASGKTTLGKRLAAQNPDYYRLDIDEFRNDHHARNRSRSPIDFEADCIKKLYQILKTKDLVIWETTGTARYVKHAMRILHERNAEIENRYLDTPPEVCIKRFNERPYNPTLPYNKLNVKKLIYENHIKLGCRC